MLAKLPMFLIVGLLAGAQHAPARPSGVPASAVWVGGADGGAFFDCVPSYSGEPNPCTVYNDGNGDVYMSGKFVLEGQGRGATANELKFEDADGHRIHLEHDLTLRPLPPKRSGSVPKTALLADNGVYVDCKTSGTERYRCVLYLASTGRRFFTGTYKCDKSLEVPCSKVIPRNANRSEISLQNAGSLRLIAGEHKVS
jgi:hypothetical protein